ncbi:MAG: 16S rRNA (uracil(1498)-N(3))-methyltransferase [Acidaminococcales bacterium]|jgi:16S rRNA (uracil1498-N3)-methyltransferase|nr:16S rRNA (uracil(1498)-N(3))-methyltransferase [Acidaminococcales bacterium]
MRKFFIKGELSAAPALSAEDSHHVKNVLRLKPGDFLCVANETGQTAIAEIKSLKGGQVSLNLTQLAPKKRESALSVVLGQGLCKGDKMDFVCQKAVELGAAAIAPLALERSVARYDAAGARLKQQRWQKVVLAAGKQCRRDILPCVYAPMSLPEALVRFPFDLGIIAYEGETGQGLREILRGVSVRPGRILLLIGPEGGFGAAEIKAAEEAGVRRASLGPRVLRTETAAIAALSVIMYEFGDLGETNA